MFEKYKFNPLKVLLLVIVNHVSSSYTEIRFECLEEISGCSSGLQNNLITKIHTLFSAQVSQTHSGASFYNWNVFSVQVFTLASYRRQTYIVIFNITFGLLKTNFERVAIFNKIDSVVELPKLLTSFKCHEKRQRGLKIIKEKKIKTG